MDTIDNVSAVTGKVGGSSGRRRRRVWTGAEKIALVTESLEPGASVSVIAARNDMNANLLFTWRRQAQRGEFGEALRLKAGRADGRAAREPLQLVPIEVTPVANVQPPEPMTSSTGGKGSIEIELATGVRVRVDKAVDERALRRVLSAVKGVW
jgi:transposase